ncbi:unnamed protein product [Ilex paraguariensis]|uniref:Uncharacterized protein n=1 Tax=Ilex paraguariensis TaxID=185542 RepID=A0ABC8SU25_9AQUA
MPKNVGPTISGKFRDRDRDSRLPLPPLLTPRCSMTLHRPINLLRRLRSWLAAQRLPARTGLFVFWNLEGLFNQHDNTATTSDVNRTAWTVPLFYIGKILIVGITFQKILAVGLVLGMGRWRSEYLSKSIDLIHPRGFGEILKYRKDDEIESRKRGQGREKRESEDREKRRS